MKIILVVITIMKISQSVCCGYEMNRDGNFYTVSKDSVLKVDTLVFADEWENKDYLKLKNKKGFTERKGIKYLANNIILEQTYVSKNDKYVCRSLKFNGSAYDLNGLYKKTYNTNFDEQYYFMGNLVTAKHYGDYTLIDLLLVQYNCLGEFCNDVVILTLKINSSGKLSCSFHDEDLTEYSL